MVNATLKITWSEKVEYVTKNADVVPASGGVYEIQGRKKTDGGYTRRYVGTSDNLRQAYAKHLSTGESNEKLRQFLKEKKSFFRYVKSSSDQVRKDLERGLYSKYRHSFIENEKAPSGSGKYMKISVEENNA
ncbi:MAG: hypothetical protein E6K98_02005 [Thaumarchaeota archaeon]|nr:MAG: hypothetical protein E6K98_02005 [Nitrososphaerota archaeon]TLX95973.1 MAG: hypothetical protein E6K91_01205 [Nitrososphaerota archaeon]